MLTRRDLLRAAALAPLGLAGCRCKEAYPQLNPPAEPLVPASAATTPAVLRPGGAVAARTFGRVVDVHGHFFNASDIPVRGFLAECIGHQSPFPLDWLAKAAAPLADRIAERAPTAAEERSRLLALAQACGRCDDGERWAYVRGYMDAEAARAARHVAEITRSTEFLRRYRTLTAGRRIRSSGRVNGGGISPLSADEVLEILTVHAEPAVETPGTADRLPTDAEIHAGAADGMIAFLQCMTSLRARNLHQYIRHLHRPEDAFGVDVVLGAMVDFDRWIDCPPRSPQGDQVALYALLAEMHGGFLRPVVAYNPWTDIAEGDASLTRVKAARACGFVAAKIYPAMGYLPANNATTPVRTSRRRPDLKELDGKLEAFFDYCAETRLPILAHGEHKNGRDDAHDAFGGPTGWRALFARYRNARNAPVVSIGHFGGVDPKPRWTQAFAELMNETPAGSLYADIGYWDALVCPTAGQDRCRKARRRLRKALQTSVGSGTAADRVMFGTDWFVIAQLKGWARYPDEVLASLRAIGLSDPQLARIFRGNAEGCFAL